MSLGFFSAEALPLGWFADEATAGGWFSRESMHGGSGSARLYWSRLQGSTAAAGSVGEATGAATCGGLSGSVGVSTGASSVAAIAPDLIVNPALTYQTIDGWEATSEGSFLIGASLYDPNYAANLPTLLRRLVYEMGINAIQLPVRSGALSDDAYWAQFMAGTITYERWRESRYNTVEPGGTYYYDEFDWHCDYTLRPFLDIMAERGETPRVGLVFVDFVGIYPIGHDLSLDATLYAQIVKTLHDRMVSRMGITPDAIDIILEPENCGNWNNGTRIGNAIVALRAQLPSIEITAPSPTNASNTVTLSNAIVAVTDAQAALGMVGYHRYDNPNNTTVGNIKTWADARSKKTGMTEWFNATIDTIFSDLTVGGVSLWQKWGLVSRTSGASPSTYYWWDDNSANIQIATNSQRMALFFPFVRRDAVRVAVASSSAALITAFENANGNQVVFLKRTTTSSALLFSGLDPGSYGVRHIPDASTTVQNNADVVVDSNGNTTVTIPAGYTVIYKRDARAVSARNVGTASGVSGSTGLATGANTTTAHAGSTARATGAGVAAAYSGVDAVGTSAGTSAVLGHAGSLATSTGAGAVAGQRGSTALATGTSTALAFSGTASVGAATGASTAIGHAGSHAAATGSGLADSHRGSQAAAAGAATVQALSEAGSIAAATGQADVLAHSGAVGLVACAGTANAHSGASVQASGIGSALGRSGSIGEAAGTSVVDGVNGSAEGVFAQATGAAVIVGHSGFTAKASGTATAQGLSALVSIGSCVGTADVVGHSGSSATAAGSCAVIALRGSTAESTGVALALAQSGYDAEAAGDSIADGHAGYVAHAIGGAIVYGIGPAPDNYYFVPRWLINARLRGFLINARLRGFNVLGRKRNLEVKKP